MQKAAVSIHAGWCILPASHLTAILYIAVQNNASALYVTVTFCTVWYGQFVKLTPDLEAARKGENT